jgi:hypothetical protein
MEFYLNICNYIKNNNLKYFRRYFCIFFLGTMRLPEKMPFRTQRHNPGWLLPISIKGDQTKFIGGGGV